MNSEYGWLTNVNENFNDAKYFDGTECGDNWVNTTLINLNWI